MALIPRVPESPKNKKSVLRIQLILVRIWIQTKIEEIPTFYPSIYPFCDMLFFYNFLLDFIRPDLVPSHWIQKLRIRIRNTVKKEITNLLHEDIYPLLLPAGLTNSSLLLWPGLRLTGLPFPPALRCKTFCRLANFSRVGTKKPKPKNLPKIT